MRPFAPGKSISETGGSMFLDRLIQAVTDTFDSLAKAVTNDRIVTIALAVTDTKVFHGLGFSPVSWEVVDRDTDANVWRSPTENTQPSKYIILQASAPVTVKLRFN